MVADAEPNAREVDTGGCRALRRGGRPNGDDGGERCCSHKPTTERDTHGGGGALPVLGAGAPPGPSTVPSASVALTRLPTAAPLSIGCITSAILSPGFNVRLFHPWRAIMFGEPASMLHSRCAPPSSTTTWVQACGLVHWSSLTVPVMTTLRSRSNAANE